MYSRDNSGQGRQRRQLDPLIGFYVNDNPRPGVRAYPSIEEAVAEADRMPDGVNAVLLFDPLSEHTLAGDLNLSARRSWFFRPNVRDGTFYANFGMTTVQGGDIICPTAVAEPNRRVLGINGIFLPDLEIQGDENWLIWERDCVLQHTVRRTHGDLGCIYNALLCSSNGQGLIVVDEGPKGGASGGECLIYQSVLFGFLFADPANETPFQLAGNTILSIKQSRVDLFGFGAGGGVIDGGGVANLIRFQDALFTLYNASAPGDLAFIANHGGVQNVDWLASRVNIYDDSLMVDLSGAAGGDPDNPPIISVGTLVPDEGFRDAPAGSRLEDSRIGTPQTGVQINPNEYRDGSKRIIDTVVEGGGAAAQLDTGFTIANGEFVKTANLQILDPPTAAGGAVKAGLGDADPDQYGLTADLLANTQAAELTWAAEPAGTALKINACDAAGAALGTLEGGRYRVRVETEALVELADI